MQLTGELLSAVDMPFLMSEHCKKITPQQTSVNSEALAAWEQRNASLLADARGEIDRAERHLKLSTSSPAGTADDRVDSIAKLRSRAQVSVSQMLAKNGRDFERRFCSAFPKYLVAEDKDRSAEIQGLVQAIRKHPERPIF